AVSKLILLLGSVAGIGGRQIKHSEEQSATSACVRRATARPLCAAGTPDAWHSVVVKLRKKILLIDHEPRLTGAVRRALENAGRYAIHEEHDTAFAFQVARWFHPDLILIDLANASADTDTLAQQLQGDGELRDTPLLCLSKFISDRDLLFAGVVSG